MKPQDKKGGSGKYNDGERPDREFKRKPRNFEDDGDQQPRERRERKPREKKP